MPHHRVEKVWGEEEWIVNRSYCGKVLRLKAGYVCSLHYHNNKDETFYVLDGRVRFQLNKRVMELGAGESLHVPPAAVHSFAGITAATIIEFSTFHDEADVVRLTESERIGCA